MIPQIPLWDASSRVEVGLARCAIAEGLVRSDAVVDVAKASGLHGECAAVVDRCAVEVGPYEPATSCPLDQAKRDTAYKQAVKTLADDPYAIYLYQIKSLTGTSSKVSGWKAHGTSYVLFTNAVVK